MNITNVKVSKHLQNEDEPFHSTSIKNRYKMSNTTSVFVSARSESLFFISTRMPMSSSGIKKSSANNCFTVDLKCLCLSRTVTQSRDVIKKSMKKHSVRPYKTMNRKHTVHSSGLLYIDQLFLESRGTAEEYV